MKNHGYRDECRTETIPIRFSPSEIEQVRAVARAAHDYPSSYLRKMVLAQLGTNDRHGKGMNNQ